MLSLNFWLVLVLVLVAVVNSELLQGRSTSSSSSSSCILRSSSHELRNDTHRGVRLRQGVMWFSLSSSDHAFEPGEHLRALHELSLSTSRVAEQTSASQWLVHVQAPVTAEVVQSLQADLGQLDCLLGAYVPRDTYVVFASPAAQAGELHERLLKLPAVVAATPMEAHLKVCDGLWVDIDTEADGAMESPGVSLALRVLTVPLPNARARLLPKCDLAPFGASCSLLSAQGVLGVMAEGLTKEEAKAVVLWLAQQPEVHFVEHHSRNVLHNKFAKFILQSGKKEASTPLWHHQITGKGEVVAVSDTGVDADHCFFRDEQFPTPYDKVNMEHRKVVMYDTFGDRKDEFGGHGTHVAGSIAGNVLEDMAKNGDSYEYLSQYNGMAYDARLAVFDFSVAPNMQVPDDLERDYLLKAYNRTGARISSNSWGSDTPVYNLEAQQIDNFVWEHRDMLVLYAAGNNGADIGDNSLTAPSVAKNIVCVGASMSTEDSFSEYEMELGLEIHAPKQDAGIIEAIPASFGKHYSKMDPMGQVEAVWTDPRDACSTIKNAKDLAGKVAVIERGACTFVAKAKRLNTTEALFMIVANNVAGPPIPMGGAEGSNRSSDGLPAGIMVSNKFVATMDKAVRNKSVVRVSGPADYHTPNLNQDRLAPFSSRGPTLDGRLKPDVVSPGMFIVSASSDGSKGSNQCHKREGVLSMQGTSMATPITAGGAALLRQYFADGFYPSGKATPDDAMNPSSALLRAMLISSTIPLIGSVPVPGIKQGQMRGIHSPMRGYDQGYGRVELDNVLHFANVSLDEHSHVHKAPSLFVVDFDDPANPLSDNQVKSFCFDVTSETNADEDAFRATLTWTDPPAAHTSWQKLVNDHDLFVLDETDDTVYIGNQGLNHYQDSSYLVWDEVNNNEKVKLSRFTNTQSHRVSVHVHSVVTVGDTANNFALVVNGNFKALGVSECDFHSSHAYAWALASAEPGVAPLLWFWPVVMFSILFLCVVCGALGFAYYRRRSRDGPAFSGFADFRFWGAGGGAEPVPQAELEEAGEREEPI